MDAQMQTAFLLMQQELQALRTAGVQQQMNHAHDIHALQAAAAVASAAAAAPATRGPSLRIAPPAHYNGSTPPLDDWLASMRQQFAWYQMTSDAEQVRTAAAHLKGPALDWWEHPSAAGPPTTWLAVDAGLRARFQPITTADTARIRLATLEQGKHSINDYVAIFRRLIVAIPTMDVESQLFQFTRGLKPALYMHLRQAMPTTLEAAIALAVRMGTAVPSAASSGSSSSAMDLSVLLAELDGREVEAPTTPPAEAPVTRSEFTTLLAAIQQSNNRRGGDSAGSSRGAQGASGGFQGPRGLPRIKGFSPEKVKEYMDSNRCFGCHKIGHVSRECSLRKIDASGRATWSN
jgi:hypothetical protein